MRTERKLLLILAALATGSGACKPTTDPHVMTRLDRISSRLDKIEQTLSVRAKMEAAGGRPEQAKPPEEAPAVDATVYAAPVEGAPYSGLEHAPITIVVASEFACPFCNRATATIEDLRKRYGDKIKVVYKSFIVHPDAATTPALAACAAARQGKYPEMAALIWKKGFEANDLGEENMRRLAGEVGLDLSRYERDFRSKSCKQRLARDQEELLAIGTNSTPTFYINGRRIVGAAPVQQFQSVIDEELTKVSDALMKGVTLKRYYTEYVIGKGYKNEG